MASDGTPQAAIPDRDLTGVTQGLTQKEMFEGSLARFGRNEVVNPEVSLVKLFIQQFIGIMHILLICAILSFIFGDYADFASSSASCPSTASWGSTREKEHEGVGEADCGD